MPRGRKKKFRLNFNIKKETVRSIFSLSLILLSILMIISFFAPGYAMNARIQEIIRGLFGWPSLLLPVILGLLGILFIESFQFKLKEARIVIGLFILLLALSGLFHVFITDDANDLALDGKGGGLIGYRISEVLKDSISIYGAVLVLIVLCIIAIIFILDVSLEQLKVGLPKVALPNLKFNKNMNPVIEINPGDSSAYAGDYVNSTSGNVNGIEPKVEIIPTMSEPQSGKDVPYINISHEKNKKVSTTLGLDKIWTPPPFELLAEPSNESPDSGDIKEREKIIKDKLRTFGISSEVVDVKRGPSVTQYALKTGSDVRLAKIAGLHNDLALALASPSGTVRIEAPIPGTSLVGIEVPNNKRAIVNFKSLIGSGPMKSMKSKLGIILGKDVGGQVYTYDMSKMPHLLVAGTTGSGKSQFIHNLLFSILFRASPQEVKFILIDPKRVELSHYQDIPHLLTRVVTDMDKAPSVFKWAVEEMMKRYKLFEQERVMNIDGYNEKAGFQSLPYIVIVVDEFAEIMVQDPSGVEKSVVRLAQLARATGIHLVLALQRPTTNIITGIIKANIPSRIAFNVNSNIDSRVIIDQPGAEKLLGRGDMLFVPPDSAKPIRLQAPYISPTEIKSLVDYLKLQGVSPDYKDDVLSMDKSSKNNGNGGGGVDDVDDLFSEAVDIVTMAGRASASLLQTKLAIGYARAARILAQMEDKGIVGPAQGSKPREVIKDTVEDEYDAVSSLR